MLIFFPGNFSFSSLSPAKLYFGNSNHAELYPLSPVSFNFIFVQLDASSISLTVYISPITNSFPLASISVNQNALTPLNFTSSPIFIYTTHLYSQRNIRINAFITFILLPGMTPVCEQVTVGPAPFQPPFDQKLTTHLSPHP